MRCLSLALTFLAATAFADEKAKPNTLTAKEIADGWILLFDGETTFGWKTEGDVTVKDGMLVLKGGDKGASLQSSLALHSFELRLETPAASDSGEIVFEGDHSKSGWRLPARSVRLQAIIRKGSLLNESDTSGPPGGALHVSMGIGVQEPVSVRIVASPNQTLLVQSIRLRPSDTKALFNGKDLTGWKEFKPTKDKKVASKFSVTKEGWLNVKNGPGDLQTEGQWADFVVQLECISNGKHLNSGLFFRAIPDLYQQGYEAQIRNQWEGDDRTKPVDFGTGAIYRRQPARKVVSTDGEWFTMTVAAHGRHIATWVNGYQVTDWTDDRKESDNARNGFKKGKGALSIQGHDSTTDLSFRNIRIQSLDAK